MAYMKDSTGRRLDDLDLTQPIVSAPTIPPELGWPAGYALGPIGLTELPGTPRVVAACSLTPETVFDAVSTARTAPGATYYVQVLGTPQTVGGVAWGTGSDANNGTSPATPLASIGKAVDLANAGGVPARVYVAATATYYRGTNPTTSAGTGGKRPLVDMAFIAVGGRVQTGTYDNPGTPSTDATHTKCYTIAVTANTVNRVMDTANLNRDGNYTDLLKVADAATCNAVPGSWAHVSGTLYIHRADEAAVTALNTRYYRSASTCFQITSTSVNVYIGGQSGNDGWDCEGGSANGVLDAGVAAGMGADKVLAVSNSTFKYGGGAIDTAAGRGVSVDSWRGLAIFANCRADSNLTDGFNVHNSQSASGVHVLTINCAATDNGRPGRQSCNGLTLHEDVKGIDLGGRYVRNRGGSVRNIDTSKQLLIGTLIEDDLGDVGLGGGGNMRPTAIRMDDTAECWADRVRILMPPGGFAYSTGGSESKIHKRDCWPVPQPDAGPGTIDNY